jgi:hypothetical protein
MKQEVSRFSQLEPTFVCGHRRSGTTLLMSLIDSHPELFIYPDDSKFFHLFYPNIDESNLKDEKKSKYIIENNIKNTVNLINGQKYLDFPFDEMEIIDIFNKAVGLDYSWKNLLNSLIYSFWCLSPQNKTKMKRWVEKTTSSEIYALEIIKKFPNAKFIHVVREPKDNYASLKTGWESKYKNLTDTSTIELLRQSCIDRGVLGLKTGLLNRSIIGNDKYLILRYEDLVGDMDNSLSIVAEFLDVDRHSFSLSPTFFGKPWKGNNLAGERFSSVVNSQVGRWHKEIEGHEGALMEFYFDSVMKAFNYEKEFTSIERVESASKHYRWTNFGNKKCDLRDAISK